MFNKMITVYAIFGVKGAGKSTHRRFLEKKPKYIGACSGEICENIKKSGEPKEQVGQMIEWDKDLLLYPDDFTTKIVDEYLIGRMKDGSFNPIYQIPIFDGYPRNVDQLHMMDDKYEIRRAVRLIVPYDVAMRRVIGRERPQDNNIPALERRLKEDSENIDQIITDMMDHKNGSEYPKILHVDSDRPKEIVHNEIYNFFKD